MSSYVPMQTVTRTMAVLSELNARPFSRIQDLSLATNLPAPTLVRILETLTSLGFVENEGRRVGYKLTEKVRSLSAGYSGIPELMDKARVVLEQVTAELLWPVALASLEDDAMVVRLSTIPTSPHAHTASTLNKRLDLLTRAHGRAYLAFCTEPDRKALFDQLSKTETSGMNSTDLYGLMQPVLTRVRTLGYAERAHEIDPQTSTIAVPILRGPTVVATLGATFFKGSRPNRKQIANRLNTAAQQIVSNSA